jgi:hypothetical protein
MPAWEKITEKSTYRLKVPLGWVIKSIHDRGHTWYDGASDAIGVAMVFLFDPLHLWKIEQEKKET